LSGRFSPGAHVVRCAVRQRRQPSAWEIRTRSMGFFQHCTDNAQSSCERKLHASAGLVSTTSIRSWLPATDNVLDAAGGYHGVHHGKTDNQPWFAVSSRPALAPLCNDRNVVVGVSVARARTWVVAPRRCVAHPSLRRQSLAGAALSNAGACAWQLEWWCTCDRGSVRPTKPMGGDAVPASKKIRRTMQSECRSLAPPRLGS
jgi:hypothetical protein